jgi:hypothetical protein
MPQTLTYGINVKVEKGPEIKSEAKFGVGLCAGQVEETVCSGQLGCVTLHVDDVSKLDMLVIASNIYSNDKDLCPVPAQNCQKYLRYNLEEKEEVCPTANQSAPCSVGADWPELTRPLVLQRKLLGKLDIKKIYRVRFRNELSIPVKVSVLVVRPRDGDES